MNRRELLTAAAKLGANSALSCCTSVQVLALPVETRHALWYAGHCVNCGIDLQKLASLAYGFAGRRYWCRFCAEYGPRDECATYRTAPPAWV